MIKVGSKVLITKVGNPTDIGVVSEVIGIYGNDGTFITDSGHIFTPNMVEFIHKPNKPKYICRLIPTEFNNNTARKVHFVWGSKSVGQTIFNGATVDYPGLLNIESVMKYIKEYLDKDVSIIISWQLSE